MYSTNSTGYKPAENGLSIEILCSSGKLDAGMDFLSLYHRLVAGDNGRDFYPKINEEQTSIELHP